MFWNFFLQSASCYPTLFPVYLPTTTHLTQPLPSIAPQPSQALEYTKKRNTIINLTAQDLDKAGYQNNKKPWTEQEDEKLKTLRDQQRLDWTSISAQLPQRNPKMCYSRYRRLQNQAKELWKSAQNQKLLNLVAQHGEDWKLISQHFEKRTHKQVKEHYLNYLRPQIKRDDWTIEEDLKLVEFLNKFGKNWKFIEKNFEGRTQNQIKNRYFGRLKKLSEKKSMLKEERKDKL